MRSSPYFHERHLLEAIRQHVITQEQYEGLVAIARSMDPLGGTSQPDGDWLSALQGVAAAFAVGIPGVYLLFHIEQLAPAELIRWCALGVALSLAVGLVLRRSRPSAIAASVLLAAGAAFTWGLAAGAVAELFHTDFWDHGASATMLVADSHARLDALLVGDLAVIATAAWLTVRSGIAAAAGPGVLASVHFIIEFIHRFFLANTDYFGERQAAPWIAAAGLAAMVTARAIDKRYRGRVDAAFWIHIVGLLSLGFALTSRVTREPGESAIWSVAALAVVALGLRWDRRIYVLCGSVAWLFWPAMLFKSDYHSSGPMIAAFVFSSVTLAGLATFLRSRRNHLAPAPCNLRSVWL